jgi:hypothetical protein
MQISQWLFRREQYSSPGLEGRPLTKQFEKHRQGEALWIDFAEGRILASDHPAVTTCLGSNVAGPHTKLFRSAFATASALECASSLS